MWRPSVAHMSPYFVFALRWDAACDAACVGEVAAAAFRDAVDETITHIDELVDLK